MELAKWCYGPMFMGCTSLVNAPELPATVMAESCYGGMFGNCDSMVIAPELPAMTLAIQCYRCMFTGCDGLIDAPYLPATTLEYRCYQQMFEGCSNLKTIKLAYTGEIKNVGGSDDDNNKGYFNYWVQEKAWGYYDLRATSKSFSSSGIIYYNGPSTAQTDSGIPRGWTIQKF